MRLRPIKALLKELPSYVGRPLHSRHLLQHLHFLPEVVTAFDLWVDAGEHSCLSNRKRLQGSEVASLFWLACWCIYSMNAPCAGLNSDICDDQGIVWPKALFTRLANRQPTGCGVRKILDSTNKLLKQVIASKPKDPSCKESPRSTAAKKHAFPCHAAIPPTVNG